MKFTERKKKLDYLLEMIEKGRCFSLKQVAEKYGCSERTVRRMITELKEDGYNIYYCRVLRKFRVKNK
ncbi:MAG: HTH domain-containing protein [Bacteroidales bacterium]